MAKRNKQLHRAFGTSADGIPDLPVKISNVQVARIAHEQERGCSFCFPHGVETSNSTRTKNRPSLKLHRKNQFYSMVSDRLALVGSSGRPAEEKSMNNNYPAIYDQIVSDSQYKQNRDWGKPRRGHPEGSVRAHIVELEKNLEKLRSRFSDGDYWKLKILIHTHDTFKAQTEKGVRIDHPQSHASLARRFLESYCDDLDLLNMVQYHDEPYALWTQRRASAHFGVPRQSGLSCAF